MMDSRAYAELILKRLDRLLSEADSPDLDEVRKIFEYLILEWTDAEGIHFHSLFSRCAFLGNRYNLDRNLKKQLHRFRKTVFGHWELEQNEREMSELGISVIAMLTSKIYKIDLPTKLLDLYEDSSYVKAETQEEYSFKTVVSIIALDWLKSDHTLIGVNDDHPEDEIRIKFNLTDRNENFNENIRGFVTYWQFPQPLKLIDVEIDNNGLYLPSAIVIEPDYLMDVTSVSECFTSRGADPISYVLHKFLPSARNYYLLRGSVVNYLLDLLVHSNDLSLKDIYREIFQIDPIGFALMTDAEVKKFLGDLKMHFGHMRQTLNQQFPEQGIIPEDSFLEPAFYSPEYGLQGRLDVLYITPDEKKASIVELKSGKPFMANKYGLSPNHFTQTLLYDLLVKSAFKGRVKSQCYILYSVKPRDRLCYAPIIRSHQLEALRVRNELVTLEKIFAGFGIDGRSIKDVLKSLIRRNYTGFIARDLDKFSTLIDGASDIEIDYFETFTGFLSREQFLAKTGADSIRDRTGFSALWNLDAKQKERHFSLLRGLHIVENNSDIEDKSILFERTEKTQDLANFRVGDIVILYPTHRENNPLGDQIFRGTLTEYGIDRIQLKLRSVQKNQMVFEKHDSWNLEKDFLESSFRGMYQSLTRFLLSDPRKRKLWLGINPPIDSVKNIGISLPSGGNYTEEQRLILNSMINAEDYFLLWGPPGTGKTSIMLRGYAEQILEQTEDAILILSYTNKAVDEICQTLLSIDREDARKFIRIGSTNACSEEYKTYLFKTKMRDATSRLEILNLINDTRIFVGTISSFTGLIDILNLKKFNHLVIDEASQILEPQLIGLLPSFDKVVMIGDHKQLPAVVRQPNTTRVIQSKHLRDLGFHDSGDSLFERLYLRAVGAGWEHCYAILSKQGRMHEDIMRFVSDQFYASKLELLNPNVQVVEETNGPRIYFYPVSDDSVLPMQKINRSEAEAIALIVLQLLEYVEKTGSSMHAEKIGIITPFRAQIALIKNRLGGMLSEGIFNLISVDTVERYQGGARDYILLSPVANSAKILELGSTLNREGIDRKLNVALSRARKQIILVGNERILRSKNEYSALLDYTRSLSSKRSSSSSFS